MLDSLRLSTDIVLDSDVVQPGSTLNGSLHIASPSNKPFTLQEIWLDLEGYASITHHKSSAGVKIEVSGDKSSWSYDSRDTAVKRGWSEMVTTTAPIVRFALPLTAKETVMENGSEVVRFSVPLPTAFEGNPLPPSFESLKLNTEVYYTVTAVLKMWPINKRSEARRVQLVANTSDHGLDVPRQLQYVSKTVSVGTWLKSSTQVLPLVAHCLGFNTASQRTKVLVHLMAQDLTTGRGTSGTPLQDALVLTLAPADFSITPAPLTLEHLEVDLDTTVAVKNPDPSSSFSWIKTTKTFTVLKQTSGISRPVNLTSEKTEAFDISDCFGDSFIPASIPPSVTQKKLKVSHYLKIKVGLRSISPDGTQQSIAYANVGTEIGLFPGAE